ncbi:hypothetical protein GJ744_007498 [Endocarpon pusillum]|uniref:Uncharacterized protein n=1 Tax=Endocarpon pusillum TaxID=364733 RepID=A0A8H7E6B3_9EURO|nr:hypothetical protein GJ744_007498 [Endocarpon pusillum]
MSTTLICRAGLKKARTVAEGAPDEKEKRAYQLANSEPLLHSQEAKIGRIIAIELTYMSRTNEADVLDIHLIPALVLFHAWLGRAASFATGHLLALMVRDMFCLRQEQMQTPIENGVS